MKHKKVLASILALASLTALTPLTAFAAESDPTVINQATDPQSGSMQVSYEVAAAYTVTIPAGVTLADAAQTADITADGILLPEGQKISVKLTEATHTTTEGATTFSAMAGESVVTYTIRNGETPVALGDEVAALDKDTTTATLSFEKDANAAPTQAGTHSEQLTFTISLAGAAEEAPAAKSLSIPMKAIDDAEAASSAAGSMVLKDIDPLSIEYRDNDTWEKICTVLNEEAGEVFLNAMYHGNATYDAGLYAVDGVVLYWTGEGDYHNLFLLFDNGTVSRENVVASSSTISDSENYQLVCYYYLMVQFA